MDIMMPPIQQQASPAPWLVRRARLNLPQLIETVLSERPDATVDEVVGELARRQVQASGTIVSMWLLNSGRFPSLQDDRQVRAAARPNPRRNLSHDEEPQWTGGI